MGETQIIDSAGEIIASRHYREGAGVVVGDILLESVEPRRQLPERYWLPKIPLPWKLVWHHQNASGRAAYRRAKQSGRLVTYDFEQ